jgi:radical SAM superfamily enzyme YgiQ (UPF0313 family)
VKVLLVVPRTLGTSYGFTNFPIGLAYISSAVKAAGHDVHILDLNNYYSPIFHVGILQMLLKREINKFNPDIVATGGLSAIYDQIHAIIELARQIKPGVVTVMGGGCVSSDPEVIMENIHADFGVIGEGEVTIVDLIEHLEAGAQDFENVDGIIFRRGTQLVTTSPRQPIMDLDSIPFPDYEGFDINCHLDRQTLTDQDVHPFNNLRVFEIAASRSCPFKCTFCFHPVGDKYRKRSIGSVLSEIRYLVDNYKVNYMLLNDELFASDKNWLLDFCSGVKQLGIKWQAQLRVDIVDDELIALLKDAGCIYISYGLESASPTILKSMRKKITVKQIENALEITKNHDILIQGNFIFGDRAETLETIVETLNWWFRHREYRINLSHLIAYPGTALYRYAIEEGLIKGNRIEYIKNGCKGLKQLNLTRLPADVFNSMLQIILGNLRPGNFEPAIISECIPKGCDPYQGYYYSARMKCPYCGMEDDYFPIHSKYVRFNLKTYRDFGFGCRFCNQRMTFLPPEIEMQFVDIVKKGCNRIVILGADENTKLIINTSHTLQNHVQFILCEPGFGDKQIHGIRVKTIADTDVDFKDINGVIQLSGLSGAYSSIAQRISEKGIPLFNLSELFRFFVRRETKEQIQAHLNETAAKIDVAKNNSNFDEANFLLAELLESYPDILDIHRNMLESAGYRKDFKQFFDVAYTIAALAPKGQFERIRQYLVECFYQFVNSGLACEARQIMEVLVFRNPAMDRAVLQPMENALAAAQGSLVFKDQEKI